MVWASGLSTIRQQYRIAQCHILLRSSETGDKHDLWHLSTAFLRMQGGEITLPEKRALFYLSQRPYLVAGSLRDQLLYPSPPTVVWAEAPPAARARFRRLEGPGAGQVGI